MRVLTLGWEFPPVFAGGVGIVCYELTKALAQRGVEVTYVMPFGPEDVSGQHVKLIVASRLTRYQNIKLKFVNTLLSAYTTSEHYDERLSRTETVIGNDADQARNLYGSSLSEEIHKYALRVRALASLEEHDLIHAHDWTTFPAAIAAKRVSGKPLIVHVHITQFDIVGGSGAVNQTAYDIERSGMHEADRVVCVSEYIKRRCVEQYGVSPNKTKVLHNAATPMNANVAVGPMRIKAKNKVVLFAGRVTLQKGPEYFIRAARMVCDKNPHVKFVLAGSGDMLLRMIELSVELGMADKFIFPGFYDREQAERLFAMADVFVMPSVSEPFGIVPLEAMQKGAPVIVSKQSGVSEILKNCLKIDFWDVRDLANKMLAALTYRELHQHLSEHGKLEVAVLGWDRYAERLEQTYDEILARRSLQ